MPALVLAAERRPGGGRASLEAAGARLEAATRSESAAVGRSVATPFKSAAVGPVEPTPFKSAPAPARSSVIASLLCHPLSIAGL